MEFNFFVIIIFEKNHNLIIHNLRNLLSNNKQEKNLKKIKNHILQCQINDNFIIFLIGEEGGYIYSKKIIILKYYYNYINYNKKIIKNYNYKI